MKLGGTATSYDKLTVKAVTELRRFPNGIKADRLAVRIGISPYKILRSGRRQRDSRLRKLLDRMEAQGLVRLEMERFAKLDEFPIVTLIEQEDAA